MIADIACRLAREPGWYALAAAHLFACGLALTTLALIPRSNE
ncbi:hypothetical protein [Kitasatospora sp. NPDC001175]